MSPLVVYITPSEMFWTEMNGNLSIMNNLTIEDDRSESPPKANSTDIDETLIVSGKSITVQISTQFSQQQQNVIGKWQL